MKKWLEMLCQDYQDMAALAHRRAVYFQSIGEKGVMVRNPQRDAESYARLAREMLIALVNS